MANTTGKKFGGRQKGSENKATIQTRKNFQDLFEGNIESVQTWLDKTASKNPAKALELFLKLAEFVQPKAKQQIEITEHTIKVKPINKS